MELFLTIITVVFLLLIGAEVFSVLLALARRMADDILQRQKLEEDETGETDAGETETGKAETGETDAGKTETGKADTGETETESGATKTEASGSEKAEVAETEDRETGTKESKPEEASTDSGEEEIDSGEDDFRIPLPKNEFVCESCGEVLKGRDLIPFIGYIGLLGRCRFCGDKIPLREFFAELLGGAVFLLLFFRFGAAVDLTTTFQCRGVLDITATMTPMRALSLLLIILVSCILFWIAAVDAYSMEIPNTLNLLIFLTGVASIWLLPNMTIKEHLIGMVCVSLPLLLIALIIPGAFGGGDIKLMAGAGLLLGWKLVLVALFFGIITGGVYAIGLLAKKKAGRKDHFAFGPFLCFGIALSMICGSQILNLYLEVSRRLYGKF